MTVLLLASNWKSGITNSYHISYVLQQKDMPSLSFDSGGTGKAWVRRDEIAIEWRMIESHTGAEEGAIKSIFVSRVEREGPTSGLWKQIVITFQGDPPYQARQAVYLCTDRRSSESIKSHQSSSSDGRVNDHPEWHKNFTCQSSEWFPSFSTFNFLCTKIRINLLNILLPYNFAASGDGNCII